MNNNTDEYNDLKEQLAKAEAALEALRRGEVDLIVCPDALRVLRVHSLVKENEELAKQWQMTFDALKDTVWILDSEQRILRSNRAAEKQFGVETGTLTGKHCWEIVHGTKEPILECPHMRMIQSLQRETMELQVGNKWYEIIIDPILNAEKKLEGSVHIISDITERRKAEEELKKNERQLRVLLQISQAMAESLELNTILQMIVDNATHAMNLGSGAIYLLQQNELFLAATYPALPVDFPEESRTAQLHEHPHLKKAIITNNPVILRDTHIAKLTPSEKQIVQLRSLRSIIYLPLITRKQAIGALILASVNNLRVFSDEEIELYKGFAGQAAQTIANIQLYESTKKYANELEHEIKARNKTELALRESEKKFRNLFQNHAAVKLIIDPDNGNIVEANPAAAKFYGWTVEELQKMNIAQINTFPPDVVKKEMYKALTLKKTNFIFKHRKANNTYVDVEVFSSRIDIGGKQFLHSIIHDITEKKKAEEKIKLLNQAVESSSVSVIITDAEGRIIYTNPYFTELTGYSPNEVLGKNPRLLKSGLQSKKFYKDLWATILSGNTWAGELRNKKKNGEIYWERIVISPIIDTDGVVTNFVAIQEDISERKRMLEELAAAKEKAEESNRLKSAFLANMSHEIRTPMNSIIGFMELLKRPGLSTEKRDEFINIINKSGERLLNTINDIIEISKIEAGAIEINISEVSITEILQDQYNLFFPQFEKKGINFNTVINLENQKVIFFTDKSKLESVLTNLVSNALKFTFKGFVELGCYSGSENDIVFYVKDTGMGIPEEKIDAIFEIFVQADLNITRPYDGSGLGLSISKAYVEMLGGKIWVHSELDKGSTFFFSLPYVKPDTDKSPTTFSENQISSQINEKLKILIAEDDETNLSYLTTVLSEQNMSIISVRNGEEAVKAVRENPDISLILMDIKMPALDGLSATRMIRSFNHHIPIIAQTAYALSEDANKALAAGCNDYISKPINQNELIKLIKKYS
jgi:PAS domain S-box-containing protein